MEPMTGSKLIGLSQDEDLVAEELFVMTTYADGRENIPQVLENLEEHLAYWDRKEEEGSMFAAGPFLPADHDDEWSGDGVVIIRADSYEEADRIAEADPMHRAGARRYELRPWLLNHMRAEVVAA